MYFKDNKKTILKIAIFFIVFGCTAAVAGQVLACDYYGHDDEQGDCTYIECQCDSDCGNTGFIGDPFCQNGDVYRNYKTYTCENAGTEDSQCVDSTEPALWYECESWQTCGDGYCVDNNITCDTNSDCGINGYIGNVFCQNGDVYQNYRIYTCNNAGTSQSYCSDSTSAELKQTCSDNQTCQNGSCSEVYSSIDVETNQATNINDYQATLNGYLNYSSSSCNGYVWFEYGKTTSYGSQTSHQQKNYSGSFSQVVTLYRDYTNYNSPYDTYHFRAIAQDCHGNTVYGQDRLFYNNVGNGVLSVSKTVRNLTTGSGWANSVYANPSDTLMFLITLQAPANQSVNNASVKDYLPSKLIYKDQLIVSGANYNYNGDINYGISLGTISAGQTVTISYQAQVASADNFSYGTTTLNNSVSALSSGNNYNQTASASVFVSRTAVYGATSISTGLTNNFWVDSFFLPLMIVILGIWMWRSGLLFGLEKWLDNKKKIRHGYSASRELNKRITAIQKLES